jgi:hypothetical protein
MAAYEGPRKGRIMKRPPFGTLVPLLIGAVSAASLQACTGWWLNSGIGVAWTVAVLFLLALCVGSWSPRSPWARATALWAGVMTGLAASLFWIGPGTIWPIVLTVSGVLSASAVLAGISVGQMRWSTRAG